MKTNKKFISSVMVIVTLLFSVSAISVSAEDMVVQVNNDGSQTGHYIHLGVLNDVKPSDVFNQEQTPPGVENNTIHQKTSVVSAKANKLLNATAHLENNGQVEIVQLLRNAEVVFDHNNKPSWLKVIDCDNSKVCYLRMKVVDYGIQTTSQTTNSGGKATENQVTSSVNVLEKDIDKIPCEIVVTEECVDPGSHKTFKGNPHTRDIYIEVIPVAKAGDNPRGQTYPRDIITISEYRKVLKGE